MSIIDRARKLEAETRRNLLRQARLLEQKIQNRLQGEHIGEEPLEIWRAIARDIEQQVRAAKGGYVFPHRQVVVTVCAVSSDRKAALAAAFEPPQLEEDVRQILRESECDVPEDLTVRLRFAAAPDEEWTNPVFHIRYSRQTRRISREPVQDPAPAPVRRIPKLRVTQGKAAQAVYELTGDVTFIGRGSSATGRGASHVNDVAFEDDEDPVNRTVSRKHARIVYDAGNNAWVLYDEFSARGTSLLRAGRTSRMAGGTHGRRLEPGDQILLGKAVLRFE